MKLISKKIMLSLGVCTALLTAGVSVQSYAQTAEQKTASTSTAGSSMAAEMDAFNKLTPEQQKEQIDQSKQMINAQMDQMIKQASSPEQKTQLESAKIKALEQVDAMAKMTSEERKALLTKAQQTVQEQLKNITPEQLKQLTPEQRAAFENLKAAQDIK